MYEVEQMKVALKIHPNIELAHTIDRKEKAIGKSVQFFQKALIVIITILFFYGFKIFSLPKKVNPK